MIRSLALSKLKSVLIQKMTDKTEREDHTHIEVDITKSRTITNIKDTLDTQRRRANT